MLQRRSGSGLKTILIADVTFSELLPIDNKRDRWLTVEEEKVLLVHATPNYLKNIIVFAIHTGCRRSEILSLTWKGNIDMKQRIVRVRISKLKPGEEIKYKVIPMLLLEMSKVRHISGKLFFVTASALKDAFVRATQKAKMEDLHFHDLRHTFGTRLAQMGKSLSEIKELMGHRSIKTTERYIHHMPTNLRPNAIALDEYYKMEFCHDSVTFAEN